MFIQKITFNLNDIFTDYVYLIEENQDKILLNIESDNNKIIIYRTFNIYGENILSLDLFPNNKLCMTHIKDIRFSLGNKYKGKIEVCVKKTN